MCTLIIGREILGPRTVVIAANRDEDPGRPSDPPRVLIERPRVVGGRDRRAGGTWLAIRERLAAVALLNRRDDTGRDAGPTPERRSRGLLTLEVAAAEDDPRTPRVGSPSDLSGAALASARRALAETRYAPFSLVFVAPEACWALLHYPGCQPRVVDISPGWHALTHADLDDLEEPRTAWLLADLAGWRPPTLEEAERGLIERLAEHEAGGNPRAAVCIHDGRMVTVSSSLLFLAPDRASYRHAEGRPCEQPFLDCSALLSGERPALEKA